MQSLFRFAASHVPPGLVQRLGGWQFRYPILKPLIRWAASSVQSGESVIRYGVGKGLRFDPGGGNPGYALGTSGADEQAVLARLLGPGKVFYEIGANVGFYAVLGAKLVGPTGHVYAFEPFPASAATMKANLFRNGFHNSTVIPCAVSNKSGTLSLLTEGGTVEYRLSTSAIAGEARKGNGIEVPVVVIDELVGAGQLRPPDVIMMDVEGSEIDVLQGMSRTIQEYRPAIVCEVHWLGSRFVEACEELKRQFGYSAGLLDGGALPTECERYHALLVPAAHR